VFLLGLGVDGETFVLPAAGAPTLSVGGSSISGSDVFANLHLTFELGV
jgi:hypothetical protein